MATAKTNKALQAERMAQAADRLDFLAANARILRDPAVYTAELLGFTVTQTGGRHEVRPC